jgi:hypothetical protein
MVKIRTLHNWYLTPFKGRVITEYFTEKKTKILKTNCGFTSIFEHEFGRVMIHRWRTSNYFIWNNRDKEDGFLKQGQAEQLRSGRSWQAEHRTYKPLLQTCRHTLAERAIETVLPTGFGQKISLTLISKYSLVYNKLRIFVHRFFAAYKYWCNKMLMVMSVFFHVWRYSFFLLLSVFIFFFFPSIFHFCLLQVEGKYVSNVRKYKMHLVKDQ